MVTAVTGQAAGVQQRRCTDLGTGSTAVLVEVQKPLQRRATFDEHPAMHPHPGRGSSQLQALVQTPLVRAALLTCTFQRDPHVGIGRLQRSLGFRVPTFPSTAATDRAKRRKWVSVRWCARSSSPDSASRASAYSRTVWNIEYGRAASPSTSSRLCSVNSVSASATADSSECPQTDAAAAASKRASEYADAGQDIFAPPGTAARSSTAEPPATSADGRACLQRAVAQDGRVGTAATTAGAPASSCAPGQPQARWPAASRPARCRSARSAPVNRRRLVGDAVGMEVSTSSCAGAGDRTNCSASLLSPSAPASVPSGGTRRTYSP